MTTNEIILFIKNSQSFDEVRNADVLPEPDYDDGFYFISYCHRDYKVVLPEIVNYFEANLKIWYDRFLESGKSWKTEVNKKIASYYCKGVVLYITKNFLQSPSCLSEIECAIENNKSCIFVLVDVDLDTLYTTVSETININIVLKPRKVECLNYGVEIKEKIAVVKGLEKPALFDFYFNRSIPVFKIFRSGRIAFVKKLKCNDMRTVEIPQYTYHKGKKYRVAGILPNAFQNNAMLEEVTIPNGWMMLMAGAFTRCKSLRVINLGVPKLAGFIKVGILNGVFVDCPNLSEINKSKGIILLERTFRNSQGIKSIDTRGFILTGNSFSGCVNLGEVTLSRRMRGIGRKIFENCKALNKITIPKKVKRIEPNAFRGCENLKEVTIESKSKLIYKRRGFNRDTFAPETGVLYIDEIFEYAEKVYFKKTPKFNVFKENFREVASDKTKYSLFVKDQL